MIILNFEFPIGGSSRPECEISPQRPSSARVLAFCPPLPMAIWESLLKIYETSMGRIHANGLFEYFFPGRQPFSYRLRMTGYDGHQWELDDPYRFLPTIGELDLVGVQPTAHVLELVNSTRPDEERQCLSRELALRNAPESRDGAFVIPKIG